MSGNPFNLLSGLSRSPPAAAPAPPAQAGQSAAQQHQQQQQQEQGQAHRPVKKRKGHRGGKKKRQRRRSFAIIDEDGPGSNGRPSATGLYQMATGNLSGTSIDSEALLDHREHQPMRTRRSPTMASLGPQSPFTQTPGGSRLRTAENTRSDDDTDRYSPSNERAPLLSDPVWHHRGSHTGPSSYGAGESRPSRARSPEASSLSTSAREAAARAGYHINNPPSVPASPNFTGADRRDMTLGDVMIRDDLDLGDGSPRRRVQPDDAMSDIDAPVRDNRPDQRPKGSRDGQADAFFPGPGMSDTAGDDTPYRSQDHLARMRRRRAQWPDLSLLEEWKHMEKEDRSEERRAKTITEPQLINGRLRPLRRGWYEAEEIVPYRFTYFNEEFQSTIHSQTISELVQPGSGFEQLFIPEPRVLSDDESDLDDDAASELTGRPAQQGSDTHAKSSANSRPPGFAEPRRRGGAASPAADPSGATSSGRETPSGVKSPEGSSAKPSQATEDDSKHKSPRYGERPVWWLDVLCPTEAEMKLISTAFGIHPLTAEDIMLQEAREKVELFRNYYFVNYRTFDQDINSENYLEPVNMYVVVFRECVLSFHFSVTPHPANVRRRIRQLRDYLILSSDWISYAIIDDITDVFQPLIHTIEEEVDDIDDAILRLHSVADRRLKAEKAEVARNDDSTTVADLGGDMDMLRRVGDCRKRVMSLYRLLGNKADVIKGFAKRCNERWEVAPRSEIGLYLGDIQDHIVTMTSNLGHYEKILARSHGNYLAQINIRMNERSEQTADVLGKLTVLGTIVLPMNIITGLWGMNVWVPGQEYEGDLTWFVCITAGLIFFGLGCYAIAKRVYGIV